LYTTVGLVLGVFTDSVAYEATDSVLVNEVGCFDGINVIIVVMDGERKDSK